MSQQNVEIVRRIYANWAPGSSPSESNLLHPDIEWVNPRDALEPGIRKGIDAFTSITEDLDDTIGDFRMEVERFIDVGDRVVVIATMRGHGTGSGVEIDNRHGAVWSIRDGKAVRFQWFHEPEQALEAVGLREEAMSQENADVARLAYQALAGGGLDRFMEHFTDDVDYRAVIGAPDDIGPIRGKDALRAWLQDWIDMFDGFKMELLELINAGDDTVVWVERFSGRAKRSGVQTDQVIGGVFTIRNGKIARGREYATRGQALEAAGLRE
jgi:uncharacterized protein